MLVYLYLLYIFAFSLHRESQIVTKRAHIHFSMCLRHIHVNCAAWSLFKFPSCVCSAHLVKSMSMFPSFAHALPACMCCFLSCGRLRATTEFAFSAQFVPTISNRACRTVEEEALHPNKCHGHRVMEPWCFSVSLCSLPVCCCLSLLEPAEVLAALARKCPCASD